MSLRARLADWLLGKSTRVTPASMDTSGGTMGGPVGGWSSGWWPVIRESLPGAWQKNVYAVVETAINYSPVFACVTLIAQDVGKLRLRLVEQDDDGIWVETTNPAYTPVLRKPNRYQTTPKFIEQWVTSKLIHGNTYVLKTRDARGVVNGLFVLDPMRVRPLVAADGSVWYDVWRDNLAGIWPDYSPQQFNVVVPQTEIIHDTMCAIFHPLIGVSPIFAAGYPALQGLKIQDNSTWFFSNGSRPGGLLTAPGAIGDDTAARLKNYWDGNFTGENAGKVAVLGDGLKYEALSVNAIDAQLIDQLHWTAEMICAAFHVPPFMVGLGPMPPYQNVEPMTQQYYAQCLQSIINNFETVLDEGLEFSTTDLGTEFDLDDLIWMDTNTRTKAAKDSISAGALSPDEARSKFFGLGPVTGGDTPYMQQQMYSLKALAERDADKPFSKPTPAAPPSDDDENDDDDDGNGNDDEVVIDDDDDESKPDADDMAAAFRRVLRAKCAELIDDAA